MNSKECRICFIDTNLISLFETIDGTRISDQIEMIGKVKISDDDNLPKYICKSCISDVREYMELQRQIIFSHRDFYEPPDEIIIDAETADNISPNDFEEDFENTEISNQNDSIKNIETERNNTQSDFIKNIENAQKGCTKKLKPMKITGKKDDEKNSNGEQQMHTPETSPKFTCLSCNHSCDSQNALRAHIKEAHIETKENNTQSDCIKNIENAKKNSRKVCNKRLKRMKNTSKKDDEQNSNGEQQMNTEKMNREPPPKFTCLSCNHSCDSHDALRAHIREAHIINRPEIKTKIIESRRVNCETCSETFSNKKLLRIHKEIHKKFLCPYCPKAYSRKTILNKHLRLHACLKSKGGIPGPNLSRTIDR